MSQFTESPVRTFEASGALSQFRRVKFDGSFQMTYAGAADKAIGTMERDALAANELIGVRLRTAPGTRKMVAAGAISKGATAYAAANGKIDATGTVIVGMALEASGADGDIIEVLPQGNDDTVSDTGTTSDTFTIDSDSSAAKIKFNTNSATGNFTASIVPANLSGNITLTLPAATGTFATLAGTESLSAKTLVSPVISTGLTASGSAANTFAGSTGTFVTSTGLNTLSGLTSFKSVTAAVAAAGSTVADAGQLGAANVVHLTSDSAAKGVKLGTGVLGQIVDILNDSATAAKLYAASGGTLNGLSADAAVVIPASKGVRAFCTAADTWIVFDMTAKATTA